MLYSVFCHCANRALTKKCFDLSYNSLNKFFKEKFGDLSGGMMYVDLLRLQVLSTYIFY